MNVVSSLYEAGRTGIKVVGGRYGLGSRTPHRHHSAIFEELKKDAPQREFTIGIVDDVTNLLSQSPVGLLTLQLRSFSGASSKI